MRIQLLLLIILLPIFLTAGGDASHKIKVDTDPLTIKSNQPFSLFFYVSFPDGKGLPIKIDSISAVMKRFSDYHFDMRTDSAADWEIIPPKAKDFSFAGNHKRYNIEFGKNDSINEYIFIYLLIPKKSGNLLIEPCTVMLNHEVCISDSFWIQVSDEKISVEDSLKKISDYRNKSYIKSFSASNFDDFDDFPNQRKAEGVHFEFPDSVYKINVGQSFKIKYSLSFVNVEGMNSEKIISVSMEDYHWPKEIKKLSVGENPSTSYAPNYSLYSKDYILTLQATKNGTYIIPHVRFAANGQQWLAPEIKVIVK